MLSAFFIAQLFWEISDSDNLSSEYLVINMSEELLFNCSAKELKTNPKEQSIQFHDAEYFTRTFVASIRGVFEMEPRAGNSVTEQVKNITDSIKAYNESVNQESGYTYNGLSNDIQSQFPSTEAGKSDNSFLRKITFDSHDASSAANAGKISGSGAYPYLELDRKNKARRVVEKEIKEEEEDE